MILIIEKKLQQECAEKREEDTAYRHIRPAGDAYLLQAASNTIKSSFCFPLLEICCNNNEILFSAVPDAGGWPGAYTNVSIRPCPAVIGWLRMTGVIPLSETSAPVPTVRAWDGKLSR
jgi:hypothetical protein